MFPDKWKKSEVIPLVKEGDNEIPSNNCPISLLPALSKICERVALNQFTEYLTRCNRLTNHQSGNKKSHSTETLNIFITDTIFKAMDSRRVTALVLLDLSKAFDSIDHTILLRKLRALGVSQPALEWFRSYLYKRTQSVRIESFLSDALPLSHGVPQGSILGPLLFNVYINDLPTLPKACSVESYVDDSKLYLTFQSKDADLAMETMCEDLKTVAAWFCSNSLLINPDKTKLLVFGTRQMLCNVSSNFKLSLLGKELSPVPFAKDLGVFMVSTLSFDEHVMQITSKCIASLCQINRVRHVLDKKTLMTVINALVFSRLFYCSSVWGGISMKNVLKLQSVQNFAARIITSTRKYDHIQPIGRDLNWLNVESTIKYRDGLGVFKCMNGYAPEYFCDQFILRSKITKYM